MHPSNHMKNKIILGLFFGDEGKGKTTNSVCNDNSIVVRFSGGQQAGHTVIHKGIKHVFSSFGAGTLKGRPSFFTEDTTFYLPNILNEKRVLENKGISPELYIHPCANLTTPYDVAYNRAKEIVNNHGSCGIGVGATMKRNLETPYKVFALDILHEPILCEKFKAIKNYYRGLLKNESQEVSYEFEEQATIQEDLFKISLASKLPFDVCHLSDISRFNSNFVFEGSQGILLDMDHGIFPNVTYANTTSKNALKYCDPKDTEITYCSRVYLTRHGNGWMPNNGEIELKNTEEEINVFNKYQGEFRKTKFDKALMEHALRIDNIYSNAIARKGIHWSCLDQINANEFPIKGFPKFIEFFSYSYEP